MLDIWVAQEPWLFLQVNNEPPDLAGSDVGSIDRRAAFDQERFQITYRPTDHFDGLGALPLGSGVKAVAIYQF